MIEPQLICSAPGSLPFPMEAQIRRNQRDLMAGLSGSETRLYHSYKIYQTALLFYKVRLNRFQVSFGEDSFGNLWIMYVSVVEVEGDRSEIQPMSHAEREDRARQLLESDEDRENKSEARKHVEKSENEWIELRRRIDENNAAEKEITAHRSTIYAKVKESQYRYKIKGEYPDPSLRFAKSSDPKLRYKFIKEIKDGVEQISQVRYIPRSVYQNDNKFSESRVVDKLRKGTFRSQRTATISLEDKNLRKTNNISEFKTGKITRSAEVEQRITKITQQVLEAYAPQKCYSNQTSFEFLRERKSGKAPYYNKQNMMKVVSKRENPARAPALWVIKKRFHQDMFRELKTKSSKQSKSKASESADIYQRDRSARSTRPHTHTSDPASRRLMTVKSRDASQAADGRRDIKANVPMTDAGLRISSKTRKTLYCLTRKIEGTVFKKDSSLIVFNEVPREMRECN